MKDAKQFQTVNTEAANQVKAFLIFFEIRVGVRGERQLQGLQVQL
jgi:hypothetical protein